MEKLIKRFQTVSWTRGNGSIYFCLVLCVVMGYMMMLLMQYSDVRFAQDLAASRSDMIADSAAVYAQSYDYKYNKSQAEAMVTLLTTYNNQASDKYELTTKLAFPADDVLTISATVRVPKFFSSPGDEGLFVVKDYAVVKSVDVFGDIFIVPESMGHASEPPSPENIPGTGGADLAVPN